MNNRREIYEVLLAGETLIDGSNNLAKLNGVGELVNRINRTIPGDFLFPSQWQIYKEPKWYENIPDSGVLCWVKDDEGKVFNKYPETVINYCDDSTHFFETPDESWMYAKPLTKQEIQVFLSNAPEKL